MNELVKKGNFRCIFCQSTFKDKYKLQRHIQTSKKCLDNRPTTTYNCIWCSQSFIIKDDLNKHYKKCECDKEQIHIDLITKHKIILEEKDKMLEEKDKIIKDLQEKLFIIANKTTINNTTKNYTVNLTCGKPFILSRKRIVNLLKKTCNEKYMLQGEIGSAKWFIDHACRNDNNEVALQTTDRRRKILKYIDKREDTKQITGNNLATYMTKCLNDYRKTKEYNEIANKIIDTYKESDFSKIVKINEFMHPNRKFINYVCDETYDPSKIIEDDEDILSDDDDIDDMICEDITDEDIIDEEPDKPTLILKPRNRIVEPCFKRTLGPFKERPLNSQESVLKRLSEYDKFYD